MSLANGTIWEIRTTGADTNSGGFNPARGGGGTDYSQQVSPHVTIDGTTITATVFTTTTQITIAGYTVATTDLGNIFNLSGGTATAGFYEITAVDVVNNRWTLDRSAGTSTQTVTGAMGGCFATPGRLTNAWATFPSFNIAYLQAGTYTLTTSTAGSGGPCTTGNFSIGCRVEGYQTVRGDLGTKPLVSAGAVTYGSATNIFTIGGSRGSGVVNVEVDCNSKTNVTAFSGSGFAYICKANNSVVAGFASLEATKCQAVSCTNGFTGQHFGCRATSCTNGFLNGGTDPIADSCVTGFNLNNAGNAHLSRFVAYACTTAGVLGGGVGGVSSTCVDGIIANSTAKGYKTGSGGDMIVNCYSWSNTSGNDAAAYGTMTALSADPFVSSATGDFRLNTTAGGGATCRAAGLSPITQTGYRDVGAVQHQEVLAPVGMLTGARSIGTY